VSDTTTKNQTATQFLRTQHEQVRSMFSEMETAQGEGKTQLFDCLRAFLAVHETAEEEIVHPAARKTGERGEKAELTAADPDLEEPKTYFPMSAKRHLPQPSEKMP